jgi:hypothetical protein
VEFVSFYHGSSVAAGLFLIVLRQSLALFSGKLQRIPIPRTPVNEDIKKGVGAPKASTPSQMLLV